MPLPLWEWKPRFINAVFWHKKVKFQLKQDNYPDWVMFAVEEGSFRYRIGKAVGTAVFGDAILCPPGTIFEREVVEAVSFHFITLGWQEDRSSEIFHYKGDTADANAASALLPMSGSDQSVYKDQPSAHTVYLPQPSAQSAYRYQPSSQPEFPVHLTWTDGNRLSSTYFYIHQLSRLPHERKSMAWDHYLQDLWQQYSVENDLARTERKQEQRQLDPIMLEAAGWLQQHAFKQVVLQQLSATLGLSPVQFSRKFQAAYGTTPIDYLTTMRIQKAQTLLLETEMTLEQIAARCGYENGFYLSRIFSKRKGISPSLYRKMHRV